MIAGYTLAMLMGLTLGLIGAGGSILAVPIMVYFLDVKPLVATGYSLLVVGSSALVGSISYWHSGTVHFKKAISFAIPAMLMVLFTRVMLVPSLPAEIAGLPKDNFIMLLFAGLMLVAAASMLLPKKAQTVEAGSGKHQIFKLIAGSIIVGFLTGMVGAGGGFLIIPSLIAIFNFNTKEAIGTSLAVISINALVGFNGDLMSGLSIDWWLLGCFIFMTFTGVLMGTAIGKKMDGARLKQLFALFLIVLSVVIFISEV